MKFEKLTAKEYMFMEIVWSNEPIESGKLVDLCIEELNWKKSTTYTVLKNIQKKGIVINENSIVRSQFNQEEYKRELGAMYLNTNYNGSLPSFIASFSKGGKVSKEDLDEIKRIIEDME